MIIFTHRFIWKSVDMKKKSQTKRRDTSKQKQNCDKSDESDDESIDKSSSFQKLLIFIRMRYDNIPIKYRCAVINLAESNIFSLKKQTCSQKYHSFS